MSTRKPLRLSAASIGFVIAIHLLEGRAPLLAQGSPQRGKSAPPTIAAEIDATLSLLRSQFVAAAEAMPEDRYSFALTNGAFEGVRTFALQVRHVATANFLL